MSLEVEVHHLDIEVARPDPVQVGEPQQEIQEHIGAVSPLEGP